MLNAMKYVEHGYNNEYIAFRCNLKLNDIKLLK